MDPTLPHGKIPTGVGTLCEVAFPGDEGEDVNDDPWDTARLDEAFIRSASVVEPSAEERIRQHQRRVRVESLYQRMAEVDPGDPFGPPIADEDDDWPPRARPPHLRRIAIALLTVLMIGAIVRFTGSLGTPSTAAGTGSSTAALAGQHDVLNLGSHSSDAAPAPSAEERSKPIGTPPPLPSEEGPFTFLALQSDGRTPMAYDPCRPIHYVVNSRTAPTNGQQLIDKAIAATSRATGLTFIADGATTENPSNSRAAYQPDKYGPRWAPLLIAWSDPGEVPELDGDTAGLGGSTGVEVTSSPTGGATGRLYVTGLISLDGPQLAALSDNGATDDEIRSIIQHELGHVVGLNHVEDIHQLMYPTNAATTDWGPGDLRGLSVLGEGSCFPEI